MYGLDKAKGDIVKSKTVLVVEGYTDVIALHSAGHQNAVATLGTALTAQHVKLLSRFAQRLVYIFDGDEAGLRAADRAVEFIDETITPEATKNPVMLDVIVLPKGSDPADMVGTKEGAKQFSELLDNSTPLISFALARRLSNYNLSRPEQQMRALEDAAAILAPIKTSVLATNYARDLADMLAVAGCNIEISQVLAAISRAKVGPVRGSQAHESAEADIVQNEAPVETFDASEVEILAFMIANPSSRVLMMPIISEDMLSAPTLREVYRKLTQDDDKRSAHEVLSDVIKANPHLSTVFSEFDFEAASKSSQEVGVELARIFAKKHGKREVRSLKAQLRQAGDTEAKKELMERIIALQQEIIDIDS
jgi:DNA primase